jgi:hypothetical protein
MNVIAALREYITKVVSEATGMKVLLLDKETVCVLRWPLSTSPRRTPRVVFV